jgi:hypothetical protein
MFAEYGNWIITKDADPLARLMYERHYSCYQYKDGRKRTGGFIGVGEKLVLVTQNYDALFVWLHNTAPRFDNQVGVQCSVFRNEGGLLSSNLILQAEELAKSRWKQNARFFTYVNPTKIKSSNPGACFKHANWRQCGQSAKGLLIFEKFLI